MNSWIFTFASDHPFAFCLALCPTAFAVIGVSWQANLCAENVMNLALSLYNQSLNAFVIAVRGYAPLPPRDPEPAPENETT